MQTIRSLVRHRSFPLLETFRTRVVCRAKSTTDKNDATLRPLDGIRIVDLTRVLAGPYCTMILGDLGADIIKVEHPETGDETRAWGPPFLQNESLYFLSINRNKKSIAINIKDARGAKIIQQLAQKSDIFLENFVPDKLKPFGLDYGSLSALAPQLIYCSITGYGQDGPYKKRGGYDVIAAGMGGLMHITGPENGEPCRVGVAMTDLSTGLYACSSIMAALLLRQKTGRGQHIDCNLLSTQVASLSHIAANYLNANKEARRIGTGHESIVPYQAFKTKDAAYIIVGAGNNRHFKQLCKTMHLDSLPDDERFSSNQSRVRHRNELISILQNKFNEKSLSEWLQTLDGCTFPYGPINSIEQVFNDPQVIHTGIVQTMKHPVAGDIRVPGPAVRYSAFDVTDPSRVLPPPLLGQHTNSVLQELLGLSLNEIEQLRRDKVIT